MKSSSSMRVVSGLAVVALTSVACGADAGADADEFPTDDVTMVVPYDPGSNTDTQARALTPCLEEAWDVRVLVENQPGANGTIGTASAVNAEPDGLTLGVSSAAPVVLGPLTLEDVPFTLEDIRPLGYVSAAPIIFYTSEESEFDSIDDVVAHAQDNSVAVASSGPGSFTGELVGLFNDNYGTSFDIVPNDSSSETIRGVVAGDYDIGVTATGPEVISRIDDGDIQLLARGGDDSYEYFPGVPTFDEAGYDELLPSTVMSLPLIVSADVPDDIAAEIENTMSGCITDPDVVENIGEEIVPSDHVDGDAIMAEYIELYEAFEQIFEGSNGTD